MEGAVRDREFPAPNHSTELDQERHNAIRQNYTAMVENIDRWVGLYLDELEKRSELDNTIVVFSSDHGEMLGDHNRWRKNVPYEASVGVPLMVAGPGVATQESAALVSLIDVGATFLDYAQAERPTGMTASSLRALLEGSADKHRDHVVSGLFNWRMVTDGRYKLVQGFNPERQKANGSVPPGAPLPTLLFDLQRDPDEVEDFAEREPKVVELPTRLLPQRNPAPLWLRDTRSDQGLRTQELTQHYGWSPLAKPVRDFLRREEFMPNHPTRRDVLLTTVAAAMARVLPAMAAGETRPNIVWVVCHDIHAPLLGTYGNSLAKTPTIDALAEEGIRFDNAFSVAPVCSPSRFSLVTGMDPTSCGPSDHMRGIGHVPEEFKSLPVLMREAGYYATNNVFTDYNCDLDPDKIWDECSITAHWRNRPEGKPFFCVYNYLITHESRVIHFEGDLVTDPAEVTVPPYLPDTPEIRTAIAQNIDLVNRQDVALKVLLDQLDEDGLRDNTIVFFMADHGGVAPRSKRYCYEEGVHIPFIVRVPDALAHLRADFTPGQASQQVISNLDAAPTVLVLAGLAAPDNMHGQPFLGQSPKPRDVAFSMRNRMDERYDIVRTARNERYRYIRNYSPHRVYGLHNAYPWQLVGYQVWEKAHMDGTLNADQDRFWNEKPAEELYDIEADPHQLKNLAGDPAHANVQKALSAALDEHMIAVNDNGFVPEGTQAEGYWPSREEGAYPLRDVLDLARTAIERKADNAPSFIDALGHDKESVRYWAAQGLLMLNALPDEARAAARSHFDNEQSLHVRCVLAEVLGKAGEAPMAVEALTAILESDASKRVKLLALEALTYLPMEAVRSAREAVEGAGKVDEYSLDAASYLKLKIDGTYTPSSQTFFAIPNAGPPTKEIGDPRI
ncbi:sulfatase-like hydrolase/transferase [Consotaella aegiceratis]|uniref:sulfatase-like hydrolase/transferase n=1 Tax=Consotaella aegiceratis TaxID=3097961 RepID=UPI002F3E5D2E